MHWVSLKKASEVTGISTKKLARLVKSGIISSKENLRDYRVTLVDLTEITQKIHPS